MRKSKGALSKGVLAGILALLLIGGGFFAFQRLQSNPKVRVAKAVMGVREEFLGTLDSFNPDLGIGQILEKLSKDGKSSTELNLQTDYFAGMNIKKAGIGIVTKNIPTEKKASLDVNVLVGNLVTANVNAMAIDKEMYVNIPTVYEKAFKVDLSTLGKDLQNPVLKKYLGEDVSQYKGLKIDPYATPQTINALQEAYQEYTKSEYEELGKKIEVEKAEADKEMLLALKKLGYKETKLEQFETTINLKDTKPVLLKSIEFYADLQEKQISGAGKDLDMKKELDKIRKDIEKRDWDKNVLCKVLLNKDKLVAMNIEVEGEEEPVRVFLTGEKNTTDTLHVYAMEGEKEHSLLDFSMVSGQESELKLTMADIFKCTEKYNTKDKSNHMSLQVGNEIKVSMDSAYKDIQKGVSYELDIKDLKVSMANKGSISFKGNMNLSTEKPEIEVPKDSVEVLKLKKKEWKKVEKEVVENVQTNYAPLMMFFLPF